MCCEPGEVVSLGDSGCGVADGLCLHSDARGAVRADPPSARRVTSADNGLLLLYSRDDRSKFSQGVSESAALKEVMAINSERATDFSAPKVCTPPASHPPPPSPQ